MELLLGHYCADALAAPRPRPRTALLAPHLRHTRLAAMLSQHGVQTLRHRVFDAQFAFERTDDASHRHAVAVVLPCDGHEVILRKLFSVTVAVDVQPLGVDDAVDVERLRAFASWVGLFTVTSQFPGGAVILRYIQRGSVELDPLRIGFW